MLCMIGSINSKRETTRGLNSTPSGSSFQRLWRKHRREFRETEGQGIWTVGITVEQIHRHSRCQFLITGGIKCRAVHYFIFHIPVPGKEQYQNKRGGIKKVSERTENASYLSNKLNRESSLLTLQVFCFCLICCYLRITKTPSLSNIKQLFSQNTSSHSSLVLPE